MRFTKIKGETPRNIVRLPRLGKLRLGIKKVSAKTGKEYPTETDFFVCPPEVQAKFGPTPKELQVMVPVENEEQFLRQYYAVYGGNQKLKCQGDGELCERRDDKGQITQMACPSPANCEFGIKNKCSARIDVMLVLPDINCGGVYQLSTGSVNSDIDIRSGLEMARHLFGRVSWVPMKIVREERKIPDPKTGQMQSHWPVKLYPVATIAETNMLRQDTKRILDRQANLALPEPVIEGTVADTPTEVISEEEAARIEETTGAAQRAPIDVTAQEAKPAITKQDILERVTALKTEEDVKALQAWQKANDAEIKKISKEDREAVNVVYKRRVGEIEAAKQEDFKKGFETALKTASTIEALEKTWQLVETTIKDNPTKVKLRMVKDARSQELKAKKAS